MGTAVIGATVKGMAVPDKGRDKEGEGGRSLTSHIHYIRYIDISHIFSWFITMLNECSGRKESNGTTEYTLPPFPSPPFPLTVHSYVWQLQWLQSPSHQLKASKESSTLEYFDEGPQQDSLLSPPLP